MQDPIKYFIWYIKFYDISTEKPIDIINWTDFGYSVRDNDENLVKIFPIINCIKIKMNGYDREHYKPEIFWTDVTANLNYIPTLNTGEYFYSFSLFPTLLQPSGSANYTDIQETEIVIDFMPQIAELLFKNQNLRIKFEMWGCSYNILRVMSGMAGLAFFK
jgi:hypothetical protein